MANLITCVRILCGLILLFVPAFSKWFYVLYLIGGISDILDGWAARRFGIVSDLGARLDTAADILFFGVVLVKMFCNFNFPIWIILWAIFIAVLRLISILIGLISNHKLVSEHSIMNKISGLLLFLIPLCIGKMTWQPVAILIITGIIATIASVQELFSVLKGKSA